MPRDLKLLLAQLNPTVGAIESNAEKIIDIILKEQASHDVIIFPELALTGYPLDDLLFHESLYSRVEHALDSIKTQVGACIIILGHPSRSSHQHLNTASFIENGQITKQYHKQALPNYGVFDERRYFTSIEQPPCVFELNGYQIGFCICEDLWAKKPVERLIAHGVDIIICINASPFDYEKYGHRHALMTGIAKQGPHIVYVNLVGGQDEIVFDGRSLVMDKNGVICARAIAFKEENLSVTVKENEISGAVAPLLKKEALIYDALKCGLLDYINKNGFPGVLIGLSGGIDSALTLAIAVDALGAERVHGVLMPSRYTASISVDDALHQTKQLKIKHTIISIESAFDAVLSSLAPTFQGLDADTTEENIQARIRGLFLMALSNKIGHMVLTTSNKSESAVGYATLYGDMAGGFGVLKDVFKTDVYALANYRNELSNVIPERIINRAPSAELAPDQKDQDSLPEYEVLDSILKDCIYDCLSMNEIIAKGHPMEVVSRVMQLLKRAEYKRQQAAPGIKISPRAFGKDWRYPITSAF